MIFPALFILINNDNASLTSGRHHQLDIFVVAHAKIEIYDYWCVSLIPHWLFPFALLLILLHFASIMIILSGKRNCLPLFRWRRKGRSSLCINDDGNFKEIFTSWSHNENILNINISHRLSSVHTYIQCLNYLFSKFPHNHHYRQFERESQPC